MIHVFSARGAAESASPQSDQSLTNADVQDTLLENVPPNDRPRMKAVLDHFAIHTILTISPGKAAQRAWRELLPSLATDYHFVLNGILAVGCLHLSTAASMETERDTYQDMAATQMNIGMAQYQSEVQTVTTTNAEALFVSTVCTKSM